MRKTFVSIFTLVLMSQLGLADPTPARPAATGEAEAQLFSRLVLKEKSFFGIDADVRRLLNDPDFEVEVRKWYQAVNPSYVESIAKTGNVQDDEVAEMRAWAAVSKLGENNASQLRMRQLMFRYFTSGLPSEKAQIYLAYFLRTDQVEKAKALLAIYATEYALFAGEYAEDPRHLAASSSSASVAAMYSIATQLVADKRGGGTKVDEYAQCALRYGGDVESFREVGICLQSRIQFVLPKNYSGPLHVVSRTGFTQGNAVSYYTSNRHDPEVIEQFKKLYSNGANPVADQLGNKSIDDLSELLSRNSSPFSGLPLIGVDSNPLLAKSAPGLDSSAAIFPELVRGIRSAKHTIFVDMFFLGGTLGATMANELIAASERGVKVFILHDTYNSFAYRNEIAPVFESLVAYSLLHADRLTAVGSYIMGHRTGFPRYVDAILPDTVVKSVLSSVKNAMGVVPPLFPKGKSDHSKVMVIDGAGLWSDSTPIAYVGSKNWTDSSGGMTFDEVAKVMGPAAVVVQDNYYWDMWFALRSGSPERAEMQGAAIEQVLDPFDALGRRWNSAENRVDITRAGLVNVGAQASVGIKVRSGENNVDGSIVSAIDQNIYAIRSARAQIIVNDQFLYDRRIAEELIDKARSNSNVQIYVLLEPISKSSGRISEVLGGFPNSLYLDQLTYQSMELDEKGMPQYGPRWPNVHFRWKHIPEIAAPEFHLEYHMKTISVDGFDASGRRVRGAGPAMLISGSANKDNMTMTGAFRESQLELWDDRPCAGVVCGAVAAADRVFWKRWTNRTTLEEGLGSETADPFKFLLPDEIQTVAKHALDRDMSPAEFVLLMRSMIHTAYDLERSSTVE